MPNFEVLRPVAMYGWVCGSTSGFTRSAIGARTVIRGEGRQQRRLRVDVRGRADPVREGAKRDALARELSVAIGEVVHLRVVADVFPRDRSIRPRRSQGTLTVTSPDRALSSGRALAFSAVTA